MAAFKRQVKSAFFALPLRGQSLVRRILRTLGIRKDLPYTREGFVHRTAVLDRADLIHVDPTATIRDYCIIRTYVEPVSIGERTSIGPFTVIYGGLGVEIGKNVLISPHVVIVAGNHNFAQMDLPMRDAGGMTKGPIVIEDDVWIGAMVTVCDGVRIARGCVIGAGATVTKNTEPFGIYGGVPARLIGSRLDLRPEHFEAVRRATSWAAKAKSDAESSIP